VRSTTTLIEAARAPAPGATSLRPRGQRFGLGCAFVTPFTPRGTVDTPLPREHLGLRRDVDDRRQCGVRWLSMSFACSRPIHPAPTNAMRSGVISDILVHSKRGFWCKHPDEPFQVVRDSHAPNATANRPRLAISPRPNGTTPTAETVMLA
jgi:hypothetical protein